MAVVKLRQSGRRVIFFLSALLFCVILWAYYYSYVSPPGATARLREALGGRKAVPIFVQVRMCVGLYGGERGREGEWERDVKENRYNQLRSISSLSLPHTHISIVLITCLS
jgi:hypothetical protein